MEPDFLTQMATSPYFYSSTTTKLPGATVSINLVVIVIVAGVVGIFTLFSVVYVCWRHRLSNSDSSIPTLNHCRWRSLDPDVETMRTVCSTSGGKDLSFLNSEVRDKPLKKDDIIDVAFSDRDPAAKNMFEEKVRNFNQEFTTVFENETNHCRDISMLNEVHNDQDSDNTVDSRHYSIVGPIGTVLSNTNDEHGKIMAGKMTKNGTQQQDTIADDIDNDILKTTTEAIDNRDDPNVSTDEENEDNSSSTTPHNGSEKALPAYGDNNSSQKGMPAAVHDYVNVRIITISNDIITTQRFVDKSDAVQILHEKDFTISNCNTAHDEYTFYIKNYFEEKTADVDFTLHSEITKKDTADINFHLHANNTDEDSANEELRSQANNYCDEDILYDIPPATHSIEHLETKCIEIEQQSTQ